MRQTLWQAAPKDEVVMARLRDFQAWASKYRCPRCGGRASAFSLCGECISDALFQRTGKREGRV